MDKKTLIHMLIEEHQKMRNENLVDTFLFHCLCFNKNDELTRELIGLIPEDKFVQYVFDKMSSLYTHKALGYFIDRISERRLRVCSHCGMPMKEGYYLAGEYACSNECAIALYDGDEKQFNEDLQYDEEYNTGEVYYTEWEDYFHEN